MITTQPTTTSHALAFGIPLNEAIARLEASAAELRASAAKVHSKSEGFGQRIAAAVKRRMRPRSGAIAQVASQETFGAKLARVTKAKAAQRRGSLYRKHE
jgi:hypothetical protein